MQRIIKTLPFLLFFQLPSKTVFAQPSKMVSFSFHKLRGNQWQGACSVKTNIFQTAVYTIIPAKSIKSGKWRKDIKPQIIWAGVELDSGYVDTTILIKGIATKTKIKVPNDYVDSSIEIEIYPGNFGVLRSQDGWYSIYKYSLSGNSIHFQVDTSKEVQSSELDREIIQRASAILFSDSVWNRADDRACDTGDNRWSIYCAMVQATIDVTGAFHHRRPALQLIRKIVEERSINKQYKHRLMDYNNDPTTKFEDIKSIFQEALTLIY